MTLILFLTLAACTVPDDNLGQSGEEMAGCKPTSGGSTHALDDVTPLGFTGQALVDLAVKSHASTLEWAKGGATGLTIDVSSSATEVTFRDNEFDSGSSGIEPAMECDDDVVLEASVTFTTDDGAFAEAWDLELASADGTVLTAYADLDFDALGGSYTVTEVDPADFDALSGDVDLSIDAAGASGSVSGIAETGSDSSDPDGTVSAELFDIAAFAPAE